MDIRCGGCGETIERGECVRWEKDLPWFQANARRYVCVRCFPGYVHWHNHEREFVEALNDIRYMISLMAGEAIETIMPDGNVGWMDIRSYTQGQITKALMEVGPGCVDLARQLAEDMPGMVSCRQVLDRAEVIKTIVDIWRIK